MAAFSEPTEQPLLSLSVDQAATLLGDRVRSGCAKQASTLGETLSSWATQAGDAVSPYMSQAAGYWRQLPKAVQTALIGAGLGGGAGLAANLARKKEDRRWGGDLLRGLVAGGLVGGAAPLLGYGMQSLSETPASAVNTQTPPSALDRAAAALQQPAPAAPAAGAGGAAASPPQPQASLLTRALLGDAATSTVPRAPADAIAPPMGPLPTPTAGWWPLAGPQATDRLAQTLVDGARASEDGLSGLSKWIGGQIYDNPVATATGTAAGWGAGRLLDNAARSQLMAAETAKLQAQNLTDWQNSLPSRFLTARNKPEEMLKAVIGTSPPHTPATGPGSTAMRDTTWLTNQRRLPHAQVSDGPAPAGGWTPETFFSGGQKPKLSPSQWQNLQHLGGGPPALSEAQRTRVDNIRRPRTRQAIGAGVGGLMGMFAPSLFDTSYHSDQ